MRHRIQEAVETARKQLFSVDVEVELERPEEQLGDFATNVAMQLAGKLQKNPRDIATEIAENLQSLEEVSKADVAGPGFINITLTDEVLLKGIEAQPAKILKNQKVLVEYSDPNPFKPLHAGHLYTTLVGDVLARLVERAGAETIRLNFGGDVGLHVAKTLYGLIKTGYEDLSKISSSSLEERVNILGAAYVAGSSLYDDDIQAKMDIELIKSINKIVYGINAKDENEPDKYDSIHGVTLNVSQIKSNYELGKKWSYEFFKKFYKDLQVVPFDRFIPESEVSQPGYEAVKTHTPGVFTESDGAIVFDGEDYGLHTRVFINNEDLPTYEAKDVGLSLTKWQDYNADQSIIITATEQKQYMEVVIKAIEQFEPQAAQTTRHLTHGVVKLAGGVKMSSRKGNILSAFDILEAARTAGRESGQADNEEVMLAAVKYALIKNRIGGDVIYDPNESIATEGNSGPYLQYAHARARSILRKSSAQYKAATDIAEGERSLVRKLSECAETLERATRELAPHYLCTYLYELAQTFNRFYEQTKVVGSDRESERLYLVRVYADTLRNGLNLLGIHAPEQM